MFIEIEQGHPYKFYTKSVLQHASQVLSVKCLPLVALVQPLFKENKGLRHAAADEYEDEG